MVSPLKESYQDFTVKFGIVKEEDTELDLSPSGKKSNYILYEIFSGREEMYRKKAAEQNRWGSQDVTLESLGNV